MRIDQIDEFSQYLLPDEDEFFLKTRERYEPISQVLIHNGRKIEIEWEPTINEISRDDWKEFSGDFLEAMRKQKCSKTN